MAHRLSSGGVRAPEGVGFGGCGMQAYLLHSMRDLSSLIRS